jgi:hypothetical protein
MLKKNLLLVFLASASLQALAVGAATHGLPTHLAAQPPLSVRVNGLTMQVRTALVDTPAESLADAILGAWRDAGNAGLRFESGEGRTVLGRQRGPVHETVTLLPTDDPRATTVVHAANDSRQTPSTSATPPFALPRGMRISRTIEQLDGTKPVLTFYLESELQLQETVERLRVAILEARWILTSRVNGIEKSAMLTAARAKQEMLVVVSNRQGRTRVTLEITGHAP